MRHFRAAATLSCLLAVAAAQSGPGARLHTVPVKPFKKGAHLLPMLAPASDRAVQRVNARLAKINRQIRVNAAYCSAWTSDAQATMVSSSYVSMVVSAEYDCGGVHPSGETFAIIFDMRTGKHVDLVSLVDAGISATAAPDSSEIGGRVSGLELPGLVSLYQRNVRSNSDCDDVFTEGQGAFEVWPDADRNKLVVQIFGVAQAVRGCEYPLKLSLAEARSFGFKQSFLDAIKEAHDQAEIRKH